MTDILLISSGIALLVGIVLYVNKSTHNISSLVLALGFTLLGMSGLMNGHPSALAALLLAVISARKFDHKK